MSPSTLAPPRGHPRSPAGLPAAPGTVGATLWSTTTEQLRRFRRYHRRVELGKDAEDLHQLRVALRRLRAALDLGHEALDLPESASPKTFSRLGKALGRLRDLDVTIEALDPLVPVAKGPGARALGSVRSRLRRERRAARRAVRRALRQPDIMTATRALRRWARHPEFFPFAFRRPGQVAGRLLRPSEQRLAAHEGWACPAADPVATTPEDDRALHDLRKRAKDLRYRLEVIARPDAERAVRRLAHLRDLQDVLGALHDGHTAERLVGQASAGLAVPEMEVIRRHLAARRAAAEVAWRDLRASRAR